MAKHLPETVSLAEKFDSFSDHWAPRIVGRYNDNEVRIAKASGDFQWHKHDDSDELFLVIQGTLHMQFRTHTEIIGAGEMIIVPRGVEHFPRVPDGEVQMIIIDPKDTANTGDPETAFQPIEV